MLQAPVKVSHMYGQSNEKSCDSDPNFDVQ